MRKFLVVVDMQYDFIDYKHSKLPIPGSKKIVKRINHYLNELHHDNYIGVLFTQDWHDPEHIERMPDGTPFPQHCVANTKGASLCVDPYLIPRRIDAYSLKKNEFNMWQESNLIVESLIGEPIFDRKPRDQFFQDVKKYGIKQVDICGVALNICVSHAVHGFVKNGFDVTLLKDLVHGIDVGNGDKDLIPEKHFEGLPVSFK